MNLTKVESRLRRFATFELDLRTGELRKHGSRLRLQDQPFRVLAMLLENPGELVTHEQLRQKLWPSDTFVDFDHGLKVAVSKLRKTLDDSPTTPRFIETLPQRGYRFIYPVQGAFSTPHDKEVPAPALRPPVDSGEIPRPPRVVPRMLFVLLQSVWVAIYAGALVRLGRIDEMVTSSWAGTLVTVVLVTATVGIALRLFLLNAVAFDYRGIRRLFFLLFWGIFVLDELWSLSPFLLSQKLGVGFAFACFAALTWLPFAQRTLIRMAYPSHQ